MRWMRSSWDPTNAVCKTRMCGVLKGAPPWLDAGHWCGVKWSNGAAAKIDKRDRRKTPVMVVVVVVVVGDVAATCPPHHPPWNLLGSSSSRPPPLLSTEGTPQHR